MCHIFVTFVASSLSQPSIMLWCSNFHDLWRSMTYLTTNSALRLTRSSFVKCVCTGFHLMYCLITLHTALQNKIRQYSKANGINYKTSPWFCSKAQQIFISFKLHNDAVGRQNICNYKVWEYAQPIVLHQYNLLFWNC